MMPIYEWLCEECGHKESVICPIDSRDAFRPEHSHKMKRLPGGTGMLYFEEGRGRMIQALSDKPITSEAERKRLARLNGVVECGNTVPESVRRDPKSIAMRRFVESDKKGRWV
jgi:hypothetical protein